LRVSLPCAAFGVENVGFRIGRTTMEAALTPTQSPGRIIARANCSGATGAVRLNAGDRRDVELRLLVDGGSGGAHVTRPLASRARLLARWARLRAAYTVGSVVSVGVRPWTLARRRS
jgi:hypothetical protein